MTCPRCVTPSTCSWNGCSPGTRPAEAHECTPNSLGECGKCGKQNVGEWPINKERRRQGLPPITQCEAALQTEEQRTIATLGAFKGVLEAIGRRYCYDCAANVAAPCKDDCMLSDDNPPMAKTPAERQAEFKQAMKEAGFVRLEAYVTKKQRDKFRQLGGDEWLRTKIDAAKRQSDKR